MTNIGDKVAEVNNKSNEIANQVRLTKESVNKLQNEISKFNVICFLSVIKLINSNNF